MVDLHTHSSASDGDLRPGDLVKTAAARGIRALALTDHDTISGLGEAEAAARETGIVLIPGVELEINAEAPGLFVPGTAINGEFHLLGLGIRRPAGRFVETLRYLGGARDRRNRQILEKMRNAGIEAEYRDIEAFAGGRFREPAGNADTSEADISEADTSEKGLPAHGPVLVGRPHFGAFLIKKKIVKNQEQAFKRYLGKNRPFYVPKEGLVFSDAVEMIHESGGIAVLAHPMSLYVAWGRLPSLLGRLGELGLDGIEAWHPTAKPGVCGRLDKLARSFHLYVTAGSDFHGSARPERRLGYTAGNRIIEDVFLDDIPPLRTR
ncbi:MAG: PHP domain-containing protein [Treponema sp.]|jgi:predicted metal-dependent phosphoesterase TrpH|nr:PHP domain-containing protein [Treponema sp.]